MPNHGVRLLASVGALVGEEGVAVGWARCGELVMGDHLVCKALLLTVRLSVSLPVCVCLRLSSVSLSQSPLSVDSEKEIQDPLSFYSLNSSLVSICLFLFVCLSVSRNVYLYLSHDISRWSIVVSGWDC